MHICGQQRAHAGQAHEKLVGRRLGAFADAIDVLASANSLVPEGIVDLFRQPFVQSRDVLAHVVRKSFQLESLPAEVAREQNLTQQLQNRDHRIATRKGCCADVGNALLALIAFHQRRHQFRDGQVLWLWLRAPSAAC